MSKYNVTTLSRASGYPKSLISKKIWQGQIPVSEGVIQEAAADRILSERRKYISLAEYAAARASESFSGKSADRNKLLTFLEINNFFGIPHVEYGKVLMGVNTDDLFFFRRDIPILDECLEGFFEEVSTTGKERADMMLANAVKSHTETVRLLREFADTYMKDKIDYPPSYVAFVRIMLSVPDITALKTDEVRQSLKMEMSVACKDFVVRFLNFCKTKCPVKYGDIVIKAAPARSIPSYSREIYFELMKCVFNNDYIHEHKMIEKALEKHLYAEMWLHIALYAACGWRAADICRGWKYLCLNKREETLFGSNKDTLYDDILYDRIPDKVYDDVCKFCISSVEVAGQLPEKTNLLSPPPLRAVIRPELRTFFGMLTLIGEAHMLKSGDGYMKPNRAAEYQKKGNLRAFFGDTFVDILHGENIQSRRLNKVFLQGTEEAARKNGNSGLMAAMVAGYARNHTSMDTIIHYLCDHQLNGETAEMVVYFMMERGVFGFLYYKTILLAYPEALKKLPMDKQNELIAIMDETPLELELNQAELDEQFYIQEQSEKRNEYIVEQQMKEMLEVSQGRGKAKDEGLYCKIRARGEACVHPEYNSCLAGCCRHMIFTEDALIPLLKVLKSCLDEALHDPKMEAVYNNIMMPFYNGIIERLIRKMSLSEEDIDGIDQIAAEVLNG